MFHVKAQSHLNFHKKSKQLTQSGQRGQFQIWELDGLHKTLLCVLPVSNKDWYHYLYNRSPTQGLTTQFD